MKEPKQEVKKAAPVRKFVPFGTTLLVRRAIVTKEVSPIITPDQVEQEKPAEGVVLEVGDTVNYAAAGMNVVFGKYAGAEFPLNGETLLLMDEKELKGKVV